MSVASLEDMNHVVIVADEIESFINVVLDQAVNRIPHSYQYDLQTIADYFEGSKIKDGVKTCSKARSDAVTLGGLDGGDVERYIYWFRVGERERRSKQSGTSSTCATRDRPYPQTPL